MNKIYHTGHSSERYSNTHRNIMNKINTHRNIMNKIYHTGHSSERYSNTHRNIMNRNIYSTQVIRVSGTQTLTQVSK